MSEFTEFGDIYLMTIVETVFGTAPAMTPAANTLKARTVKSGNQADKVTREFYKPYRGGNKFTRKNKRRGTTFQTDFVGAILGGSSVGPLDALFRACGLTRSALVGPAGLRYAPTIGAADSSCAFQWFKRDPNNLSNFLRWIIQGNRGTLSASFPIDDKPTIDWDFEGEFTSPTSLAALTADYAAWQDAEDVTVLTTALTVNGTDINGTAFNFALGYERKTRHGYETRQRVLSARSTTGSFVGYYKGLVPDLYALADAEGIVTIVLTLTSAAAGKTIVITIKAQLEEPDDSTELDTSAGQTVAWQAVPTAAGNDDITIDIF